MAWTPPTTADFKSRFPQFSSQDDGLVDMLLDEALAEVGESWLEKDRTSGVLYLTAHLLSRQISEVASAGGGSASSLGVIKRRKVGDVEVEFETSGAAASPTSGTGIFASYYTTTYGRRYLELARRNFPAVLVV